MKKNINSKHIGSMVVYTLFSLFLCMVGVGNASAAEPLNPVVIIDKTSYTSSGTEVTLRLWMFNWEYRLAYRDYDARFTGDVYLCIDDKEVGKLNDMWIDISDAKYFELKDRPGTFDKASDINIDGTNVGTAQFQDFKSGQTCPYNSNTTEYSWYTVDLKLSFNKSFSYYGHKITVKGKWQDRSSGSKKDVALDNDINGFVRPINLKAQPSGDNMVFSWEQQGYNSLASTDGKWVVYKREGDNNVKLGEVAANEQSLSIEKKQYSCSKDYIMTFLPNVCEGGEDTVCGLTTTFTATGHQINDDDICQMCGHGFFRYQTSDGNTVNISNKDFGANVVAHKVVDGKCVIEFDAQITKIPADAFYNCTKLTGNLVIPNSVTEIGNSAFYKCSGFTGDLTIPNSVKTIGESAFCNCSGFTGDLTIPNSVKTIGESAFYNCSGFTGDLTIPNSVTTIGISAFGGCSGFKGKLTIPNSVTTIGDYAFQNCTGFTGVLTIPNSVTTIGKNAFNSCTGFTGALTIPNSVTTIGNSAFYSCTGFTGTLTIPNSVKAIGNLAFFNCTGFKGALTIPNSVTTIGNSAFNSCTGFTGALTIPNSVTTIGNDAFHDCTGFTGALTIPNSVTTIGENAFCSCFGFKGKLTIPNSVKTIGKYAFFNCYGFTGALTIPNSVTTIGEQAFYKCTGFTGDLSLPKSLEVVGYQSFIYCNNIKTVNFQSLPEGISEDLGVRKKTVSLSDDSYISDKVTSTVTVNAIYYTRTMTSKWGTLVLPYSLTLTGNEPYSLYDIENMTDEELVLKQLDGEVAAGTPCVVKRNEEQKEMTFTANNATLNMTRPSFPVNELNFQGTYKAQEVTDGYIIRNDLLWNVAELLKVSSETKVKVGPFRSWLDGTTTNDAAKLSIRVDDSATGIDNPISSLNADDVEYYDLNGRRLTAPQQGINIMKRGNKTMKVIIK